jgi:hypothetical protein
MGVTPDKAGEHHGYDFSMTLCEANCAGEMEDVPRGLFDL